MDVKAVEAVATEAAEKVRTAILEATREAAANVEGEGGHVSEAISAATAAFAEEMRILIENQSPALTVAAAQAAGRRAALIAASEYVWPEHLGPLFSSAEVRQLLGGVSRQRVNELWTAHRLIGLATAAGRRQFPAFQFQGGRTLDPLIGAFWIVRDAEVSEWTAASWCVSPDPALGGHSPAAWVRERRDPERLRDVARQDAARLAR